MAILPDSIARAIAYAIEQPAEVEIDEMVIRPPAQDFRQDGAPNCARESVYASKINK